MITGKKILIVSSDKELYRRFKNHFSERDYDATHTQWTGNELKSIINEVNPDLIVVDPQTPSLQGLEISLRIRGWTPVPILILSTAETRENEVRTLDLAAIDYLSEPFNIGIVATRIDKILALSSCSLQN